MHVSRFILYTSVSIPALLIASSSHALPQGGQVAAGNATITSSGTATTITQGSDRAVIDWNRFDIGAGERVTFQQPSSASIALNRIGGQKPSEIFGSLTANGQVVLSNPNGFLFGEGSRIDVAGLVATSAGIDAAPFMQEDAWAFSRTGAPGAAIVNQGTITARNAGLVALVASTVDNRGTIAARLGKVQLAGAETFTVDLYGDGLLSLAVTGQASRLAVSQSGTLKAASVLLEAAEASSLLSSTVNMDGVAEAKAIEVKGDVVLLSGSLNASGTAGGNIAITARNLALEGSVLAKGSSGQGGGITLQCTGSLVDNTKSRISVDGTTGGSIHLDAKHTYLSGSYSAVGRTGKGGIVNLTAETLNLYGTTADASGKTGGGTVLAGGGYQGRGPLKHATTTKVGPSTTLKADATQSGKGGTVVVWSDEKTEFNGKVSVRGGAYSGDGGLLEVSSKDTLSFNGTGDASAPAGTRGNLLLDPKNITIANSGTASLLDTTEIPDPSGGGAASGFGTSVMALPSGNVVITAPYDDFAATDAGAIYLFNGTTGAVISTLRGSNASDWAGSLDITLLTNGNYVVRSPNWNSYQGAVTWGSGTTGIAGTISAANSLIGDSVGSGGITALTNGNYVVLTPAWNSSRGAATWGSGTTGITGTVDATNSLVGSTASDQVGLNSYALTNGNYVVGSRFWNGNRGAATWGNGTTGITGTIDATNSLVGSSSTDQVGVRVSALANGNYVVGSQFWNGNRGAATWGNGTTGITGTVDATNSLVGSSAGDLVSLGGITALTNGNYVVGSYYWNGFLGAATWGNGTTGITGTIDATNSLVGSSSTDQVGVRVSALANGNYVVGSQFWNGNRGAATWGNGTTGITGTVDATNSLVGNAGDQVGNVITALANGNYVVGSRFWNSSRGAATWGNGTTGITGTVDATNSLVGANTTDYIGMNITALANGNYVVGSYYWNGSIGSATWGNGTTGLTGTVDATNSLVGSSSGDRIGFQGIEALSNGNYVVRSQYWNTSRGHVTWGNGTGGSIGAVDATNSLVGTNSGDRVGRTSITAFSNGNYAVNSINWNSGTGALTIADGSKAIVGEINVGNSILGTGLSPTSTSFNPVIGKAIVGVPSVGKAYFSAPVDATNVGFAVNRSSANTLAPSFLTKTLDTGTDVRLQASNDITINSPIVSNNAGGTGGDITLSAGRSILLNADLVSDGGDITLIGNDTLAHGVVDAERDAGASSITMAPGTRLDAGSGSVTLRLENGAGKTHSTGGDITVRDVTAGSLVVENRSSGGDVTFENALESMNLSVTATGDVAFNVNQGAVTPLGTVTLTGIRDLTADSLFATGFTLIGGTGDVSFSTNSLHSAGGITIDTTGDISGGYHGVGGHLYSSAGDLTALVDFDTLDIGGTSALLTGRVGLAGPATQSMANRISVGGLRNPWPAYIPGPVYTFEGFQIGYQALLVPSGSGVGAGSPASIPPGGPPGGPSVPPAGDPTGPSFAFGLGNVPFPVAFAGISASEAAVSAARDVIAPELDPAVATLYRNDLYQVTPELLDELLGASEAVR